MTIKEVKVFEPAVFAEGLTRQFGAVRAVDGVNLAVSRGEIYGFLGPNGAGKSTCVRMLTTLLLPSSGQARVAGYDVRTQSQDVRLRIGAALQEAALDPKQTGREVLRLQARLYGLSWKETRARLAELESFIDIGAAMDRMVGTYSGGMKRRLDLAAALVHNPEVLFLDEPTAGLDPISRARVWDEVRHINKELGVTIFLTTQYLEEADSLANRVGIIHRGKIVIEGTPLELKRRLGADVIVVQVDGHAEEAKAALHLNGSVESIEVHGSELTISASRGAALLGDVAVALREAGVPVQEITLRTPTLDDVFLNVTGGRLQQAAPEQEAAPRQATPQKEVAR
jgi:ABC-2 type transport system ATP-binding protein